MHEKRIVIRWRDMDGYGHVNNAVYLTYLEEARDEWLGALLAGGGLDYVVARAEIDFRRELRQSDGEITVRARLVRLGTASIRTREEIVSRDGRVAAEAQVVLVMRDRTTCRSRPLTPAERAALEADGVETPVSAARRKGRETSSPARSRPSSQRRRGHRPSS